MIFFMLASAFSEQPRSVPVDTLRISIITQQLQTFKSIIDLRSGHNCVRIGLIIKQCVKELPGADIVAVVDGQGDIINLKFPIYRIHVDTCRGMAIVHLNKRRKKYFCGID